MFALLTLAISLLGTQCWAQETGGCGTLTEGGSVSCTFSPTTTTNTYEFGNNGRLTVKFVTVLTTFTLTVTVDHTIDALDPNEFPVGTVCVPYAFNGSQCDEYDFTGNAGGPNGVPVKGTDYKGLIALELSYLTFQTVLSPAFGHAPGDNATAVYSEDILTAYSSSPTVSDPTMDGTLPGLSSVAAFNKPLIENDTFCFVSPTEGQIFTAGQVIEVTFRLFSGACNSGMPIRDKTARFSLSMTDSSGNFMSFPPLQDKEEGNKFHWDNKDGLNELDLSTVGLAPGHYTINVYSSKSSPRSVDIVLN
jgi:hypothetical protein